MTTIDSSLRDPLTPLAPKPFPRLGFAGVGWIGQHRMERVAEAGRAEVAAIADSQSAAIERALTVAPGAVAVEDFESLLEMDLDGIVIATPSALHAGQSIAALERGRAVFCQKPLARTAEEASRVVAAARKADVLLGVDFSYRHVRGVETLREMVRQGAIGEVFAVDLTFHNAYGPDKPWFYDPRQSGGGCLIDLGTHLIDLAFWILGTTAFENVQSTLWREGRRLEAVGNRAGGVEDCAFITWQTPDGPAVRLACSWNLSAGQDAVIEAKFHGTQGAVALRNVDGSFYDFLVEEYRKTQRQVLAEPPDAWGGRALLCWVEKLSLGNRFDPEIEAVIPVSELIDRIYHR